MRKPQVSQLVYNTLFPKVRSNDPPNLSSHIARNLVPEVRVETSTFYGSLNCVEAQYPGLDYSFPPHRMRLSRFYHHRKLFKVFDELGLTPEEIGQLCRWEGTKSARDRYEREEGVHVRDTTLDGIAVASRHIPASAHVHRWGETERPINPHSVTLSAPVEPEEIPVPRSDTPVGAESSDDELEESVGFALNQHLLEATAARERGADVSLDQVWEQWLKEAIERGSYEVTDDRGFPRSDIMPDIGVRGDTYRSRQAGRRSILMPDSTLLPNSAPDPAVDSPPNAS